MTSMKMLTWALIGTLVLVIMGSCEGANMSLESHAVSAWVAIAFVYYL